MVNGTLLLQGGTVFFFLRTDIIHRCDEYRWITN
nr:MAG TPA: hypothetical protein [Bacteriophage sp.]